MLQVLFRCFIMYCMVILAVRLMGKRQIGELQPSELVITILISELASMPLQERKLPLIYVIIPIFVLAGLEILTSLLAMKSIAIRKFLYGCPLVLIYKGKFKLDVMAKARVTIDDIMEAMRSNGIIMPEEIDYAVLETNGQLSIIQKEKYQAMNAQNMEIEVPDSTGLPRILIMDGALLNDNIKECGLDEKWVLKELKKRKFNSPKDIFLFLVDDNNEVFLVPKK